VDDGDESLSHGGLFRDLRDAGFAQALAGELDAVCVVHDAIENSVGERRVADDAFMPALDRHLAGDQQRASVVTVFDDLEDIAPLLRIERFGSPIVEDEDADPASERNSLAYVRRCGQARELSTAVACGNRGPRASRDKPFGRARKLTKFCRGHTVR
jgi:hypothetical protein